MTRTTKTLVTSITYLLLVLLCVFALWLYLPYYTTARQIARYSGEGEIRDTTLTFFTLPVPGYKIEFEKLPLDKSFSKSYTLKNLPILDRNTPFVYFRLPQQVGLSKNQSFGVISIRINDSAGNVLLSINNVSSEEFTWSYGGTTPYKLYLPEDYPNTVNGSKFKPEKNKIYTIEIDFTPTKPNTSEAEPMADIEGWLHIEAGGYL